MKYFLLLLMIIIKLNKTKINRAIFIWDYSKVRKNIRKLICFQSQTKNTITMISTKFKKLIISCMIYNQK